MVRKFTRLSYLLLISMFWSLSSNAQISVTPSDTALCPGDSLTITASFTSQFDDITDDDYFGSLIDIGFPFTFYGETFEELVISANNFLSFNPAHAYASSSYVYTTAVNNGQLNRAIMFPFQDVNMSVANPGSINYQSFGNAPNRVFVVEFCNTKPFSCSSSVQPSQYETNQVVLYENGGIIEMFIKNHTACLTWQGGTAIQGLRFDGMQHLVPGRDVINTPWNVQEDGKRFTPDGNNGYIIDDIPYEPIPLLSNVDINNVEWYEEGNPNPIGMGETISVEIQSGVSYYEARLTDIPCMVDTAATLTGKTIILDATVYDTTVVEICYGETFEWRGNVYSHTVFTEEVEANTDGCDIVHRLELTVHPQPIAEFLNDTTDLYFCKGGSMDLILKYPFQGQEYQWYRNGTEVGGNSHIFTVGQAGEYYAIVSNAFGCADTTEVVTVREDVVDIDFDIIINYLCDGGDSIQIVNNSEPGTYAWNFGEGVQVPDTNTHPTHYYAEQGEYTVKLIMTNENGCTDSLSKIVDTRRESKVFFVPSKDSLCENEYAWIEFDNQSENIGGFHWDFGDGNTSSSTNPSNIFYFPGEYEVTLTGIDPYGCLSSHSHMIFIDSLPELSLSLSEKQICGGEELRLNVEGTTSTLDLTWDFGDGTIWTDTATVSGYASHSYESNGTKVIKVTSKPLVCPVEELVDTIIVSEIPLVKLAEDTTLCLDGEGIELKNLLNNTYPGAEYKWSTGEETQSIIAKQPGLYTLEIDNFGCIGSESVQINKDCYINIPNAFSPNGDGENDYFLPRDLLSKGAVAFEMEIFNRWGQKVFETQEVNGRGWDGKYNDMEQPMGVYVYKISITYKNGRTEDYTGNVTLLR